MRQIGSQIPFTVDHVGKFLRPETIRSTEKVKQVLYLKQVHLIEDEEIKALVAKQKSWHGLRESRW